jgi:phosphoglycolate phosphatase
VAKELAIFDLDGTLIDSIGDLADAMNAVLRGLGHPTHSRQSYQYFVGDGIEMLVRRALPPEVVDGTDIPEVVSAMRQEYSGRWLATTRPFPGIPELLVHLRSRGIRAAVLSNKPDFATKAIVDELFEEEAFDLIRGALDNVPLKPDPTAALEIISEFGVEAERSVFVGDTSIDIKTGRNAGMRTIGVTWGFRGADELLEAGADHIIDHPPQLLEALDSRVERAQRGLEKYSDEEAKP